MPAFAISIQKKIFNDPPRVEVLHNVDFSVGQGEIVGVLGPSGCGKTTLLRILAGLEKDFHGEIRGRAFDFNKVSMVFQEPRLLPWMTIAQNIAFVIPGGESNGNRLKISELIQAMGLEGFESSYPFQLSGGMSQRVAIARALVTQPDLLLLDEPFSSLDDSTKKGIRESLVQAVKAKGTSVVWATHDRREAKEYSDKIIQLAKGAPGP